MTTYAEHFRSLTGKQPYEYQEQVADLLFQGRNVLLRAPTGAGKTLAVLAPFFLDQWVAKPTRLVYALPLRTLAQGIYRQARELAARVTGKPVEAGREKNGGELVEPFVTLHTGEQPDDPFFDRGTIIVTTYDQILSGLLCRPYCLSDRLHNINAAAIAGTLVIFDEFHLMPPDKAFLTATAFLRLFKDLCQSVWMTATATVPLEKELQRALNVALVPESEADARNLLDSLPSVKEVDRKLVYKRKPLSADDVLEHHERRSIALLNTVSRAQALYEELRTKLGSNSEVKLFLLHSRFFSSDRREKEALLDSLFGPAAQEGNAILVSTQVIEAGIDISCENLHTEVCPMNALVQRIGRCARFPGQKGIVHVYELPKTCRAWLPYGDPHNEQPALKRTRELLARVTSCQPDSTLLAQWVQRVHGEDDEQLLRRGWRTRMDEALELLHRTVVQRNPAGVAHLIRGDDVDNIRVLIAKESNLPDTPGSLESIALPRWSLDPLVNGEEPVGWYWDSSDDPSWKPLTDPKQLAMTYAVCLRPRFARYDSDFGLRLGSLGNAVSPPRIEPKRPGYAPLRMETWVDHARRVAEEAQRRVEREGRCGGLLLAGLKSRYGMDLKVIMAAARACGYLHDLGKLQEGWQQWAREAQRFKDKAYVGSEPLAHVDFDPDSPDDRKLERSLKTPRPPHACASAYWSLAIIGKMLVDVPESLRSYVVSACLAAIISHHGAFIPNKFRLDMGIQPLINGWENAVAKAVGCKVDYNAANTLRTYSDKKGLLKKKYLDQTTKSLKELKEWWPLVAYLMRTLRLSDQRATSEWTSE